MLKVLHIINGLETGGAEIMLQKLLSSSTSTYINYYVLSLIKGGMLQESIENLGIPLLTVDMQRGKPTIKALIKLRKIIHQVQPNLIISWMYHASLASQLASLSLFKSIPVVWNIRHSLYSLDYEKKQTSYVIQVLAKISKLPDKILYNSRVGATQHQKIGFDSDKTIIIPNGFDTTLFFPSDDCRMKIRSQLSLSNDTYLIGLIARYHPMKDHVNFLKAAALLLQKYSDVKFLLAGSGVDWDNKALSEQIYELKINNSVYLLGQQQNIPCISAALDIASSSSYGEGFPNVIGEAMACGVPCVVTDVGDSSWLVAETGKVVPPKNPQALANAWKELIELSKEGRTRLGETARRRIVENFSLDSVVRQYEFLYKTVLT